MSEGQEAIEPNRMLVHDFRNLLAVIVNYCELIAGETTDPEAVKADIAEIRTAAERALELVDQFRRRPAEVQDSKPAGGMS